MKQALSASIVFSSITVFDMLKDQLHIVFFVLNQVIAGKVSLDRMNNFVKNVGPLFLHRSASGICPLMDTFRPNY